LAPRGLRARAVVIGPYNGAVRPNSPACGSPNMTPQPIARGSPGETHWTNVLAALTVLAGVVSIIFILDDTKYPAPMWRMLAFEYLLRDQDVAGSALVIAIAIAAWLLRTRSPALDPV